MAPDDSITAQSCRPPRPQRNLSAAFGIGRILLFFPPLFLSNSYKDSSADGDYVHPVFLLPIQVQMEIMLTLSSCYGLFSSYLVIFMFYSK